MLHTKSVATPPSPRDGLRVLVTRFRGRGLPAGRYDVWLPSLGPSEKLLRSFLAGEIDWHAFARRYRAQLFAPSGSDDENRTIKDHGQKSALRLLKHLAGRGNVTLLCHCAEDAEHCHRHLLAKVLAGRSL
jgi:uncharacterized protein YeaO (DUF488 family)